MFTASEIAEVTGGRLIGSDVTVTGVSTDTRTIEKGMLFVAVRGESFDGNDFIDAAAERGAAAVISDREPRGAAGAGSSPPHEIPGEAGGSYRQRRENFHKGHGVRGAFRKIRYAENRGKLQ